jgi:Mat/Ecp fimbriae major subunit
MLIAGTKKMAKATMTGRSNRISRARAVLGLMLAGMVMTTPATAATAPGQSRVTIVTAGQLVKSQDLRFGLIIPATTAGTVTINPATSARTSAGALVLAGTGFGPAEFSALGNPNQNNFLQLVMPTGNLTLNRAGGGATMTVNNWTFSGSGVSALNAQGFYIFRIGARLNVGANQLRGTYSGTFNMTVNFF